MRDPIALYAATCAPKTRAEIDALIRELEQQQAERAEQAEQDAEALQALRVHQGGSIDPRLLLAACAFAFALWQGAKIALALLGA
jgi:hypothetical protein